MIPYKMDSFQKGLATKATGAKEFEVWRASVAVGSRTPPHVHETKEVFIVLKGKIHATIVRVQDASEDGKFAAKPTLQILSIEF